MGREDGLGRTSQNAVHQKFGEALPRTPVNNALPLRVRGAELLSVALFL